MSYNPKSQTGLLDGSTDIHFPEEHMGPLEGVARAPHLGR